MLAGNTARSAKVASDAIQVLGGSGYMKDYAAERFMREAKVTRTSQGIDARTRTMLVEMDIPNEPVRLYPGSYVNVKIRFPGRRTPMVPGEALAWRGDGLFVARLDPDDRVKLVRIQPGEDDGRRVQILSGLQGGERVVLNPSAELSDGDRVQPLVPRGGGPAAGR